MISLPLPRLEVASERGLGLAAEAVDRLALGVDAGNGRDLSAQ